MVKPHFLAVLVFGKSSEWLILLDLIAADNTPYALIFSSPFDIEDLIFSFFGQFRPLFFNPFNSMGDGGLDILNLLHNADLLSFVSPRFPFHQHDIKLLRYFTNEGKVEFFPKLEIMMVDWEAYHGNQHPSFPCR